MPKHGAPKELGPHQPDPGALTRPWQQQRQQQQQQDRQQGTAEHSLPSMKEPCLNDQTHGLTFGSNPRAVHQYNNQGMEEGPEGEEYREGSMLPLPAGTESGMEEGEEESEDQTGGRRSRRSSAVGMQGNRKKKRSFLSPPTGGPITCQVPGCEHPVDHKLYYRRYRICQVHLSADVTHLDGQHPWYSLYSSICQPEPGEKQPLRFCQQCAKFQPLADFDGDRRSCRVRLQQHTDRRRQLRRKAREVAEALKTHVYVPPRQQHVQYEEEEEEEEEQRYLAPRQQHQQQQQQQQQQPGQQRRLKGGSPRDAKAPGEGGGAQGPAVASQALVVHQRRRKRRNPRSDNIFTSDSSQGPSRSGSPVNSRCSTPSTARAAAANAAAAAAAAATTTAQYYRLNNLPSLQGMGSANRHHIECQRPLPPVSRHVSDPGAGKIRPAPLPSQPVYSTPLDDQYQYHTYAGSGGVGGMSGMANMDSPSQPPVLQTLLELGHGRGHRDVGMEKLRGTRPPGSACLDSGSQPDMGHTSRGGQGCGAMVTDEEALDHTWSSQARSSLAAAATAAALNQALRQRLAPSHDPLYLSLRSPSPRLQQDYSSYRALSQGLEAGPLDLHLPSHSSAAWALASHSLTHHPAEVLDYYGQEFGNDGYGTPSGSAATAMGMETMEAVMGPPSSGRHSSGRLRTLMDFAPHHSNLLRAATAPASLQDSMLPRYPPDLSSPIMASNSNQPLRFGRHLGGLSAGSSRHQLPDPGLHLGHSSGGPAHAHGSSSSWMSDTRLPTGLQNPSPLLSLQPVQLGQLGLDTQLLLSYSLNGVPGLDDVMEVPGGGRVSSASEVQHRQRNNRLLAGMQKVASMANNSSRGAGGGGGMSGMFTGMKDDLQDRYDLF